MNFNLIMNYIYKFFTERKLILTALFGIIFTFFIIYGIHKVNQNSQTTIERENYKSTYYKVNKQPISQYVTIVGKLASKKIHTINALSSGVIQEKYVTVGDKVNEGDVLAVISSPDLQFQVGSARINFINAKLEKKRVDNWLNSQEVQNLKHQIQKSIKTLSSKQQELIELEKLLNYGVVSQKQYDEGISEVENLSLEKDVLNSKLAILLKKGDSQHREIAQINFDNAKKKLALLNEKLTGLKAKAKFNGIIIKENSPTNDQKNNELFIGMNIKEGTLIFTIADLGNLQIDGNVNERDLQRIIQSEAKKVLISSDFFDGEEITGYIENFNNQAISVGEFNNDTGLPKFGIKVFFDQKLPDEWLKRIKLGMSLNISIETYRNQNAIFIPHEFIYKKHNDFFVQVIHEDKKIKPQKVSLGVRLEDGVEVLSGLDEDMLIAKNIKFYD